MTDQEKSRLQSFDPPQSPCVGICQMGAAGYCKGCDRSSGEIARWFYADDDEKREILARCEERSGKT